MNDAEDVSKVLDEKGREAASLASKVLLEDIKADELQEALSYLVEHRHDVLRPSIISLACEAVGGKSEETLPVSVAIVLECYYMGLLDDIFHEWTGSRFSLTLPGKFGLDISLLVSIIVKAKVYDALSSLSSKIENNDFLEISRAFKDFPVKIAEGEILHIRMKRNKSEDAQKLLNVYEIQAADIEACTRIGALIGKGTTGEVDALGRYGVDLGMLFLLKEDLMDALNFSARLAKKIREGSYPYPLLWAVNHSTEEQNFISSIADKKRITPSEIKKCVNLLFDAGAVEHTEGLMEKIATSAESSLEEIEENEAKKLLKLLAEAQPHAVLKMLPE